LCDSANYLQFTIPFTNGYNKLESLNRHICEQHRDELGITTRKKKRTCAHPLHGDSKSKPDRGINAVMSREIWLRFQFVVAIGEGNRELKVIWMSTSPFFFPGRDTELITMLFANMTIQMLRCYDIYPSSI
jgi:hypothetical protein